MPGLQKPLAKWLYKLMGRAGLRAAMSFRPMIGGSERGHEKPRRGETVLGLFLGTGRVGVELASLRVEAPGGKMLRRQESVILRDLIKGARKDTVGSSRLSARKE